jgi:branched-chain amino acid transport system ATP-binding protein
VRRGEIVSLLGPNGAGKTSVLRAIMGLVPRARGTVEFSDGSAFRRIDGLPTHRLAGLGIASVPSVRIVLPRMTVEENLEVGSLFLGGDSVARAREMERMSELFPVLGRRRRALAATLSGGEQRMLALARALMARPRLLLLDEPSLGLAPLVLNEIFALLQQINAEAEVDVLLVEQNVKRALEISHRAYVMRIGALDFEGPSRAILASGRLESAYLG